MRSLYEGPIKIQSTIEFNERMKRAYGDKFSGGDIDEFLSFV